MRQKTFAEEGFEHFRKATRREQFLDEMNEIIPWKVLAEAIEPFYPKGDGPGRPPIGIERMLRIHFLQHWFNLLDPAVEEALYDSRSMRRFVGIDLGREPVRDETTICKFRHLLETNDLGDRLFVLIQDYLQENGLKISCGTIVDATIISAPSSTKNREGRRDPEMHQTRKGNQWYFGMKARVVLPELPHGTETRVWDDSAYTGQGERIRRHAPQAKDFTQKTSHRHRPLTEEDRSRNRNKSRVRAKVEHPLLILKRIFTFSKVRYRGIHKNATRLFVACALVNLFMARRVLLHPTSGYCLWNI